ncbi:MAG: DUF1624 domain-containing protein [Lewinella sp.]|nr:DUF1624 domain-containing protein [Lewinella sp.]
MLPAVTKRSTQRIVFIDILRAYAILMMLQGHFIDTLLAEEFRQASSSLYSTWAFMRGMTAPIFFTVTGLVFVFLLLRDGRPVAENPRVRKGLRRGVFLVGVGYLLKINFPALLTFYISPWFWAVDVLHVIGLSLIALISVVALREWLGGNLGIWLLLAGVMTFFVDPYFTEPSWEGTPRFLAHYLTRDFGSNFTVVPWVGYTFLGGVLGYTLNRQPQWAFSHWLPLLLMAFGWTLTKGSHQMLVNLYQLTGWENFPVLYGNNYLFWRLGHVLIVISLFMWVVPRVGRIPRLVSKIGGETLTVYGVHYVVLYGTWLGLGLSQVIGYRSLSPVPAVVGAALFVAAHVVLIAHIETVREWVYVQLPTWARNRYRLLRIWVKRELPRRWEAAEGQRGLSRVFVAVLNLQRGMETSGEE